MAAQGNGTFINNGTITLISGYFAPMVLGGNFTNNGSMNSLVLSGATTGTFDNNGLITTSGSFKIANNSGIGATFTNSNTITLGNTIGVNRIAYFINEPGGMVDVNSGSNLELTQGTSVNQAGATITANGSLTVGSGFTNSGTIDGTGTIISSSANLAGTIRPGTSVGILNTTNDIELSGTIEIEVTNGSTFDVINSTNSGALTLNNATINFTFTGTGYNNCQTFQVFTNFGSVTNPMTITNNNGYTIVHNGNGEFALSLGGVDADGDGYTICDGDCDDNDAAINPGAVEICDGIDNNCNGQIDEGLTSTFYADSDGDGFGDANSTIQACSAPTGYVSDDTDCDDNNANNYPGNTEICDGQDNDCDGFVDEGFDVDGDGYTTCQGDCDDNNAAINPGGVEVCDGIDNNCDGQVDEGFDSDGDGHTTCAGDCDDNNSAINPGATEVCDGIDNNCDGSIDEGFADTDNDGFADCIDPDDDNDGCLDGDDANPLTASGDSDCDGVADDCDVCPGGDDSVDENGDGIPDCSQLLNYNNYSSDWHCANNKINICHNGKTLCVNKNSLPAHFNHGDWVGPCTSCGGSNMIGNLNEDIHEAHGLELEIFPNPAKDELNIHLHGIEKAASLFIQDQLGRLVWTGQLEEGKISTSINLKDFELTEGIYFIQAVSGETRLTKRLVVVK